MKRLFSIILALIMTLATLSVLAEPAAEATVEDYVGKWKHSDAYGDAEGNTTFYTSYVLLAKNGTYLMYEAQDLVFFRGGTWELENGLCILTNDNYVMALQDGQMVMKFDQYDDVYEYEDSPSMADELLPFLGTWEVTKVVSNSQEFKPEAMGIGLSLTLTEDNSCEFTVNRYGDSNTEQVSGFVVEGLLVFINPTGGYEREEYRLNIEDGQLTMETGGVDFIFTRVE